jgi:hypothetical protein
MVISLKFSHMDCMTLNQYGHCYISKRFGVGPSTFLYFKEDLMSLPSDHCMLSFIQNHNNPSFYPFYVLKISASRFLHDSYFNSTSGSMTNLINQLLFWNRPSHSLFLFTCCSMPLQTQQAWVLSHGNKICASGVPTSNRELAKSEFLCSWPVVNFNFNIFSLVVGLNTKIEIKITSPNKHQVSTSEFYLVQILTASVINKRTNKYSNWLYGWSQT